MTTILFSIVAIVLLLAGAIAAVFVIRNNPKIKPGLDKAADEIEVKFDRLANRARRKL